jgi:hypothetical protein
LQKKLRNMGNSTEQINALVEKFGLSETVKQEIIKIVENTNKWYYVNQGQLPLCYSTGDWDGKKSDIIIAETFTGEQFTCECYEGTQDGSYFFDWCQTDAINKNDWLINEPIARWTKIPM